MPGPGRRVISASTLAALVVIFGSGGAGAEGGIVVGDPVIMPTGDPLSEYDFKLALQPGNSMIAGDYVTLQDVPDFNSSAMYPPSYVYKIGSVDVSGFCSITTAPNADGTTAVTLMFTAGLPAEFANPASATSNLSIGDLYVTTTDSFPPPPGSPLFNPINYVSQTHTNDLTMLIHGSGTTLPPLVIPEPASLALVLVGAGLASPWLKGRGRGRRRAARRG